MFAVLSNYVTNAHVSHIVALSYTIWASIWKAPRIQGAPGIFILVIATLAALVFVDGKINMDLYYGDIPDTRWFYLKAFLAAYILLCPHFSNKPMFNLTSICTHSARSSSLYSASATFGVSLAVSWLVLPWVYENFPRFSPLNTDPAWDPVWDILLAVPFQSIPVMFMLCLVHWDEEYYQRTRINTAPAQYNGYIPELSIDEVPHHLVAYLALLPMLWQLHAPWQEMSSFERSVSVLSTNALIVTIIAHYFHLIKPVRV